MWRPGGATAIALCPELGLADSHQESGQGGHQERWHWGGAKGGRTRCPLQVLRGLGSRCSQERESHQRAKLKEGGGGASQGTGLESGFTPESQQGFGTNQGGTPGFPVLPSLPASLPGIPSEDETAGTSLPSLCRLLTPWDPAGVAVAKFGASSAFCVTFEFGV